MDDHNKQPFFGCIESQIGGRSENQDCADFCDTLFGRLVVVCDGMGGGPGGATASSESVRAIIDTVSRANPQQFSKKDVLINAISSANTRLRQLQQENRQLQGMGSTCICLLIDDVSAVVAQVGDSRAYQFRFGKKHWRTWDHSAVLDRVKALYGRTTGKDVDLAVEEARCSPNSNVITRALGVLDKVDVEVHELAYEKDDRFALCTDGIWGSMPEPELVPLLNAKVIGGALAGTMCRVQELGVENGNRHDNFTLALLQTNQNSKLKEPMTHKARFLIYILSAITSVCVLLSLFWGFKACSAASSISRETEINAKLNDSVLKLQLENSKLRERNDSIQQQLQSGNAKSFEDAKLKEKLAIPPSKEKEEPEKPREEAEANVDLSQICENVQVNLTRILEWSRTSRERNSSLPEQEENYRKQAIKDLETIISKSKTLSASAEIEKECKYIIEKLKGSIGNTPRTKYYEKLLEHVEKLKKMII